jgi:hypothetical protein
LKKTPKNSSRITSKKGESDTLSLIVFSPSSSVLAHRLIARRCSPSSFDKAQVTL